MRTTMRTLLILVVMVITITGCKKDPIKGCTNAKAENYNSNATVDNGTCSFKGSLIVWTKPTCSNMNLYVDGVYKGELTTTSSSGPATCSSGIGYKISMQWSGSTSKQFHFKGVVNNNTACPNLIGYTNEKDVTIEGGGCTSFEFK